MQAYITLMKRLSKQPYHLERKYASIYNVKEDTMLAIITLWKRLYKQS